MKKDMPLEGLRWSRDSGSALYDTPQNGRSRTGWGGNFRILDFLNLYSIVCVHTCAQRVYVYCKEFDGELKVKMFKIVKF